jgi:hypothetical protein
MGPSTREPSSRAIPVARASSSTEMEVPTKEHGRTAMHMDMEFLLSRIFPGMKEIGTKANTMARELT